MLEAHTKIIDFIRSLYPGIHPVPLHAPVFLGNEKKYLEDCINTTFVSYVGKYVTQFEEQIATFTGARYAVAMMNGTTALQIALQLAGVERGNEVITQALSFVATANAISHAGGIPVFIDVDTDTLGMSPEKLRVWLELNSKIDEKTGQCINKTSGNTISAIIPMHTFGHPCRIVEIIEVADEYGIQVIEDAAESLGSYYRGKHTGTFGLLGILSFNGNKTITAGGGGMLITDNEQLASHAKHITTTAKVPHPWEFVHDEIGYNYRMTNVNAAIGVAQMEKIDSYLEIKREIAGQYLKYFNETDIEFVHEPKDSKSNYWLSAIVFSNQAERDAFLKYSNETGVMTRPAWTLLSDLGIYKHSQTDGLKNSRAVVSRIVNLPSGVRHD
jgi:perosamine synthetase